jgi:hypothetical protein
VPQELEQAMMRKALTTAGAVLFLGLLVPGAHTWAAFEVTAPDGRRVLLKDDGTWRYLDAAEAGKAADGTKDASEAVLSLESRSEVGQNCYFRLGLANNLPYEIKSIVPSLSVYRADGVLYETRSVGFFSLKPGNSQSKVVLFQGIGCTEIARLKVSGGDRCEMGDLDRFSPESGVCLSRVRVVASDLVQFGK